MIVVASYLISWIFWWLLWFCLPSTAYLKKNKNKNNEEINLKEEKEATIHPCEADVKSLSLSGHAQRIKTSAYWLVK